MLDLFQHLHENMKMKVPEISKPSESFIIGVIALVFLIIGYQTALFIHNAAVTKIAANRDSPDTVYIHDAPLHALSGTAVPSQEPSASARPSAVRRHNSAHSPRAETVRRNLPGKNVENFMFNPNTATVDELCRLGFTEKQAQSIDNYRKKGGRFRRKEDFAKSYVVSDSVYRRLEPYVDIPKTDLNRADSSDFDALPGIGGWFASKMIEHRKALGGYSYKEQLMDIYRFEIEKFMALEDLVEVGDEYVTPYGLWTLPADSLRMHPYIGNFETAKAIVLYRENNPKGKWTVEGLAQAGVLAPENAKKMSGCRIAGHDR